MVASSCARCIALSLIPLALVSMAASLALLFPNGETGYLMDKHISWYILVQAGLWGSGLLVIVAALFINDAAAGNRTSCLCRSFRLKMLVSIFYCLLVIGGIVACFTISVLGLAHGPLCLFNTTDSNKIHVQLWDYPFQKRNISTPHYLYDPSRWETCEEPKNIVLWNTVFFFILLATSGLEALLCTFQIINGFLGCIFGR